MRRALLAVGVLVVAREAGAQALTLEYLGVGVEADINDRGQVAMSRWVSDSRRVLRYTDGVGIEYLDPGVGYASIVRIGNSGQVSWEDGVGHSFRYTDGIGAIDLNTLGAENMVATGINDYGHVVGESSIAGVGWVNWIYGANGASAAIVPEISEPVFSIPQGINNRGQIVGEWEPPGSRPHAYRYTPGLGLFDLGTLGGNTSVGQGINEHGDVFGWSRTLDGSYYNFLYSDAGGMENLGRPTQEIVLDDMNDAQWIVGRDDLTRHAVVWTRETGFLDLNSLLPAGTNAELFEAFAINNHNQLAVSGIVDGQYGIYRVTVHQLPAPWSVVPLAGVWAASRRRRRAGS